MAVAESTVNYDKMTVKELHAEAAKHFQTSESIFAEAKKRGGLNEEDRTKAAEALQLVDSLEAVISRKESDEQLAARSRAGADKYGRPYSAFPHAEPTESKGGDPAKQRSRKSIGQRFVGSEEYKQSFPAGHLYSPNMVPQVQMTFDYNPREQKAVLQGGDSASGGALVENDRQPFIIDIRQRMLTFLDLVTRLRTDSDTIEWVKETTFTNNAAAVAEATATTGTSGTKPETVLAYTVVTSPVQTVAHWVPVTTRMLSDYSQIRGLIDARLMLGLDLALETLLLSGDGVSPNLGGITSLAGVQSHALGSDTSIDALFKMMVKVQVTGLAIPNAVVLNPVDFQDIRLARENAATGTLGAYLYGPPSQAGPMTIWGRPLVESIGLTAGTGLVGDFSALTMILWDREQATIRTGTINDQFTRNMLTVLAELRVAFTVFREAALAKVTGI